MSIDLSSKNQRTNITDVVWIQTGFIGDIVLTTAAISALRRHLPGIKQHVITTGHGAALLYGHPSVDSIHVFSKRKQLVSGFFAVKRAIDRLPIQRGVTIQAHGSYRSSLLARLIGLPTVTFTESNASWLADVTVDRIAVLHDAQRYSLLLGPLGIPRSGFGHQRPVLSHLPLPENAKELSAGGFWIGIAPGSVWATKRWSVDCYAELCCRILQDRAWQPDARVVLIGSNDDQPLADAIERYCVKADGRFARRILNLTGRTSVADLKSVIPKLSHLVANDSSPIHFASAFNIPTTAIFGATIPAMGFGPLASDSRVVEHSVACRPCSVHGPMVCPLMHFKCMNEITVDHVWNALRRH